MSTTRWQGLTFLALALLFVCSGPPLGCQAAGQEGGTFFHGKTVRLVVGYAPGGGYDSYARLVAPALQAKLGSTVIVENQPGGGGFNALQNLIRDPGDGLTILLLNGEAAVLSAIVGQGGVQVDLHKLVYLGRLSYENRTLVALKRTPFAHIDGYLKPAKPVFFGAGSRFDGLGEPASILCDALSIPCKLITGFQGATDTALAMQRGEVDAMVTSESQVKHLVVSGPFAAVAILSTNKASLLPGVPSIFHLVQLSPEKARWLRFRAAIADFGRTLVVPSDTPPNRIAVLQKAVAAVLADPAVREEGARTERPIAYLTGAESQRTLDGILTGFDPKQLNILKKLILTAY